MKFKKVVDKIALFHNVEIGECFRVMSVCEIQQKVFMKVRNSAVANEEDSLKYAVGIEDGVVSYFPLSTQVIPCVIEAREVVSAT